MVSVMVSMVFRQQMDSPVTLTGTTWSVGGIACAAASAATGHHYSRAHGPVLGPSCQHLTGFSVRAVRAQQRRR